MKLGQVPANGSCITECEAERTFTYIRVTLEYNYWRWEQIYNVLFSLYKVTVHLLQNTPYLFEYLFTLLFLVSHKTLTFYITGEKTLKVNWWYGIRRYIILGRHHLPYVHCSSTIVIGLHRDRNIMRSSMEARPLTGFYYIGLDVVFFYRNAY